MLIVPQMLRIDKMLSCINYRESFYHGTAFSVSQFTPVAVPVLVPQVIEDCISLFAQESSIQETSAWESSFRDIRLALT